MQRFAERLDEPLGYSSETIAKKLGKISYAEAEEFCCDVRRRGVLAIGDKRLADIVSERLKQWTGRQRVAYSEEVVDGGVSSSPTPSTAN